MQTEGGPDSDKELLLGSESAASGTRVYKRRFYVLLLAATVPLLNGWIFVTWSPIQSPAKLVFGWTDQTIELMVNWSPIAYVLTIPFFTWLLDTKGELAVTVHRNNKFHKYFILLAPVNFNIYRPQTRLCFKRIVSRSWLWHTLH